MKKSFYYTREELDNRFDSVQDLCLGDPKLDVSHVFLRTKTHPKITGIAGDVIEQSILGYPANSDQEADIIVDGIPTEVKTTGLRRSKSNSKKLEAKEPMSITAVSIPTIGKEVFETSHFWNKVAHMLIAFYLYDSDKTVLAEDYAKFPFLGHYFLDTDEHDKVLLKNDWETIKNFIVHIQETSDNPPKDYPLLSSALRSKLLLLDTAPKYPHSPRFRFKRVYVNTIVEKFLHYSYETLPNRLTRYSDFDALCHSLSSRYKGKSIYELSQLFGFDLNKYYNKEGSLKVPKSIMEPMVVNMFGCTAPKINDIEDFHKIGIIGKTVTLTQKGTKTEDMKMVPIDFDEIKNADVSFSGEGDSQSSDAYSFFAEHSFLCILFQEAFKNSPLEQNVFVGFKRIFFDDEFLNNDLKPVWLEIRRLVVNNTLKESPEIKKDGTPILNPKTHLPKTSLNFPKKGGAKDPNHHNVFVRGSGIDSSRKSTLINGISMYQQWLWLDGNYVTEQMDKVELL